MDENKNTGKNAEEEKRPLQQVKEAWYSKLNISLKQVDTIIIVCSVLLAIVVVLIVLEATGVYKLFGR